MELSTFRYDSMMEEINRLLLFYPFLEKTGIGNSVMGKEIPVLRIGSGTQEVFMAQHSMPMNGLPRRYFCNLQRNMQRRWLREWNCMGRMPGVCTSR